LRTKADHCIQCDTSKISYALRNRKNATVYIAGSTDNRIIKVGLTTDRGRRLYQINECKYGGASDWEMIAWVQSANAGRVEFEAQNRLRHYQREGSYVRNGRTQKCYELFNCSYRVAKKALIDSLPAGTAISTIDEGRLLAVYDF
jgi:hypothetical protein